MENSLNKLIPFVSGFASITLFASVNDKKIAIPISTCILIIGFIISSFFGKKQKDEIIYENYHGIEVPKINEIKKIENFFPN